MKINDILVEFAPAGGGDSGNYFQALASAWYNGAFDTGSLPKGIKTQQDVERLLNRGIVCPDGKTRKLHIDYNANFDGVEIYSDDYYEYGDHDDTIDSRTGQKWGPYDFMAFSDEDLSEGLNEFAADDGNDGGEDDALRNYARMWWAGDEATQMQIERALAKMGWEIGEDEGGYDNGGVFVVRAGDENGNSYQSWPHEELVMDEGMWDNIKKSFTPDPNWQKRASQQAGHMAQGAVAGGAHGHAVGHAMTDAGVAEGSKYKCSCHPGDPDPDCPVHGLEPMEVGDALDVKKGVAEGSLEEDEYDKMLRDLLKARPDLTKKYAKDVQKSKDIESGKELNKLVKKNPGVLKTYSDAVKRDKKLGVAEGLDSEKKQRLKDLIDQYRDATDPEAYYGLNDEYPDAEEVIAQIRQEFGNRTADSVEQGPSMHYPRPGHSRGYDPMQYKSSPRITKSGVLNKQDVGSMKRDIKQRLKQGVAEGDLNEKSTSQAQFRTMAAAAHNPEFAKKVGIKQSVAREFHGTDKKQSYKSLPKKATEGAPVTVTPGSNDPGGAVDNFKQQMANNTELAYQKGMAEGNRKSEPPEADYGDDYQDMVKRVKKLAGLGPLKTQYDPNKRVYRNMPTAVQPRK